MSESDPLQLSASTVKAGETLLGDVILGEATPRVNQVRRVVIRARGELEYKHRGQPRRRELSGGPEFIWERPLRGELQVPFQLSLPPDAHPSYRGQRVQITWELVASLQDEDGKELMSWRQPIELQPRLTARPPEWIDRPAPVASPPGFISKWGPLLFPALFCFLMPGSVLVGIFDRGERGSMAKGIFGIICSLAVIALGVVITQLLVSNARRSTVIPLASLVPLAERFPRGAPARLRVFLQITKPLTVQEVRLQLSAYEDSQSLRSTDELAVQLQQHLAPGRHQFDVEMPIPQDFPPTFEGHLSTYCTLTLSLKELDPVRLQARLALAPEVLDSAP